MEYGDRIECVFATDDDYCQHLGVTLASLLQNNSGNALLFHIVYHGVTPVNLERLRSLVAGRPDVEAVFYELNDAPLRNFPIRIHLSLAAYFRLFLPDVLPVTSSRVLYLDSDIVVRHDLSALWQTPLDGHLIGAARDPFAASNARLALPPDNPEFNSGVLLIDLAGWRRERLLPRFVEYVEANEAILRYLDQDVLNVILRGRIKWIDYAWNFQARTRYKDVRDVVPDRRRFEAIRANPNIVHYTSHLKPWRYRDDVPFEREYLHYLKLTPWRGSVGRDRTTRLIVGRLLRRRAPVMLRCFQKLRASSK